jgi:uncharacterized repeat protein (TIGR03803 family)
MPRNRISTVLLGAASLVIIAATIMAPDAAAQSRFKTLWRFRGGPGGGRPAAGVIFDQAGNIYGTTGAGGAYNAGTVFELRQDRDGVWKESVLHSFCSRSNCIDGLRPNGSLVFDADGNLYGTTFGGGEGSQGTVFQLSRGAHGGWTERVLHSFTGGPDGKLPTGNLVIDSSGNLYGTTIAGGDHFGGTVFEFTRDVNGRWTDKVLYSFCSPTHCSGFEPYAGVTFDNAGNLYGTTLYGGAYNAGTVFELMPGSDGKWTENTLHSFDNGTGGGEPITGVVFDGAGNLYGGAEYGGILEDCLRLGCGIIFELSPQSDGKWKFTEPHEFTGGTDGQYISGNLLVDPAGNVFGMAYEGGDLNDCTRAGSPGCGAVFQLKQDQSGQWNQVVLHDFADSPGALPLGSLVEDAAGNLFGTTQGFETTHGTVFEITRN